MAANVIQDRIKRFIQSLPPFHLLTASELDTFVQKATVQYLQEGDSLFIEGSETLDYFFCVRQGSLRIEHENGTLVDLCGEGDILGTRPLLSDETYLASAIVTEPAILYCFPVKLGKQFVTQNAKLALYFAAGLASGRSMPVRNRNLASQSPIEARGSLQEVTPVSYSKKLIHCSPETKIKDAALLMKNAGVGSIIVTNLQHEPVGIITDKDLRNQVVAGDAQLDDLCETIMSSPVKTIPNSLSQAECLIRMVDWNVHHLVISKDGTNKSSTLGVISEHDLLLMEQSHPAALLKAIRRTLDIKELTQLRAKAAQLIEGYIQQEVSVSYTSSIITSITDAVYHQCIQRAMRVYGSPPCSFAWLGLGSHGRGEQLLRTDQDHALIFDGKLDQHQPYFLQLAKHVSEDLAVVGFEHDAAGISASTKEWCVDVDTWKTYFQKWVAVPEPQNVLQSTIFFDYRTVYGTAELAEDLTSFLYDLLNQKQHLLAYLAKDAVETPPPLSFFRNMIVERSGDHKDEFDLKLRVSLPLVDVARVLAIEHHLVNKNNTILRFQAAATKEPKHEKLYKEAASAYAFVLYLRARFGIEQQDGGRFIDLRKLNKLEKQMLRNIFDLVKELQQILSVRFPLQYLS
jgi:CBS domain-containing protein